MSKKPNQVMPTDIIFDPERTHEDSQRQRFYDEIRETVQPLLDEHTADEVEAMSTEEWEEYRRKFIGIVIKLKPNGEIVHE